MGDIYYEWITGKREEKMNREEAKRILYVYRVAYLVDASHIEAFDIAIKALEQEPCGKDINVPATDAISRQAVEDKLVELCNSLEEIFANIRMMNVDESVCGLCEYDCPAPFECKGFETDECFKLADEIRHKWQSTEDLPPVNPQEPKSEWQQDHEILKAYSDGANYMLDKIRAEIKEKFEGCNICEWFEDYDYEENDISEYQPVGDVSDILGIIDKYKEESEDKE